MHPTVLDATGYTLLLSSFVALVVLLWKGCKRKRTSPFHVLSASDVLSAAFTAIILVANHIETGMRLSYNWQNSTDSDAPNLAWTNEEDYRFPFLQTHGLRGAFNEVDRNVTLTCGMKDILMQYGLLLAALTNAFVSSLTFAVQCNLNAACIKKRCANIVKPLRNIQLEPNKIQVTRRESEQEAASPQGDSVNVKTGSVTVQGIVETSKFPRLKDAKRPTGFLVMSHWLVPFLVVGIVYFAEYSDMSNVEHTEDLECVFHSNFPINNFNTLFDTNDSLNMIDSLAYLPEYNHFLDENLSNESKSNNAEIDDVVSRVQSIIRNALSYRRNSTKNNGTTHFLNTLQPANLTEYIFTNNIIKYIKSITNINSVGRYPNDTPIEQDTGVHNSSTSNNVDLTRDWEIPLFHDVSKNASAELDAATFGSSVSGISVENEGDDFQGDAQTNLASTAESATRTAALGQNATFVSDNQIYGEIIKRIQAASVLSAAKNHYNRSASRPKLKNYIARRKPNSMKQLLSDENDNRYLNAETRQSSLLHMSNECLISTKFLKLQLFVLSFAIYFLPVLLASILQMRGKHVCKSTLETLRGKTDLSSTGDKKTRRQDSEEEPGAPQGSGNSGTDMGATKKDRESRRENQSLALEIDCMVRTLSTIKLSLILCVVLWTPVFLGTLLRVYSCTSAPQWLTDATFLSALSFGVVRNALNINIIRIQEACGDAGTKENRIHPARQAVLNS